MTAAPAGGAFAPNRPPLAVRLTMLCCLIASNLGHASEPPHSCMAFRQDVHMRPANPNNDVLFQGR